MKFGILAYQILSHPAGVKKNQKLQKGVHFSLSNLRAIFFF
jgi:hypothetical protein